MSDQVRGKKQHGIEISRGGEHAVRVFNRIGSR